LQPFLVVSFKRFINNIVIITKIIKYGQLKLAINGIYLFLLQGRILLVGGGANIEDGSSLIIHWSSGSHKRGQGTAN